MCLVHVGFGLFVVVQFPIVGYHCGIGVMVVLGVGGGTYCVRSFHSL